MQLLELAEAASTSTDPLSSLVQYGALGVIVILLVIYTRGSVARERERSDKAEAKLEERDNFIRNELTPKQIEATMMYKQVAEVLEEAIQLITEIKIRDSIRRQDSGQLPPGGTGHV